MSADRSRRRRYLTTGADVGAELFDAHALLTERERLSSHAPTVETGTGS